MGESLPPLTVGPDGPDGPLRPPLVPRVVRRIGLIGTAIAIGGALLVGVLTGSGQSAAAATFVGLSLVTGIASVATLVGAVRAEYGGRRVPVKRIALAIGLLLLAPICLILAAGAAGAG